MPIKGKIFWISVFAILATPVQAQTTAPMSVQALQIQLRQQACSQLWTEAVTTANQLLAAPIRWGLGQREQISDYRDLLIGYEQNQTRFRSIPGCGNPISAEQWERAVQLVERGAATSGRVTGGIPYDSSPGFGNSGFGGTSPDRSGSRSPGPSPSGGAPSPSRSAGSSALNRSGSGVGSSASGGLSGLSIPGFSSSGLGTGLNMPGFGSGGLGAGLNIPGFGSGGLGSGLNIPGFGSGGLGSGGLGSSGGGRF